MTKRNGSFGARTAARQLMDNLGRVAGDGGKVCQLGGGNPAWIPEVAEELMKAVRDIASDPALFPRFAPAYTGPEGDR